MRVIFGHHPEEPTAQYFYIYDTGGAHGIMVPPSLNAFKEAFREELNEVEGITFDPSEYDVITITNNYQGTTRKYLEDLGFETKPFGNLLIHFGLVKYFDPEPVKLNENGRVLNKDGTVRRKPFEYFVGDRIKFTSNSGEEKVGRVRQVYEGETGPSRRYKTRLHIIAAHQIIELVERSQ